MEILRKMERGSLKEEYNLLAKRMMPWNGLNMPIGGAICVVAPGRSTLRHVNVPASEEEIFVGVSGTCSVVIDSETFEMGPGDVIWIPGGTEHHLHNTSSETEFTFFCAWWSAETVNTYTQNLKERSYDQVSRDDSASYAER